MSCRTQGNPGLRQVIARIQKRWHDEVRFRGLRAGMSLEPEGVVLGAQTVLAKRLHDGSLEGEDARILTLLSVAYGNPIDPSVIGAVRRASKHARAGDEGMASMHIALVPLPRLSDPSDAARRLFIADGLMEDGVSPRDIWTALDFDPAPLDALEKEYNPAQPRVPAGSGRPSGEWAQEGAGSEAADAAEDVASELSEWTISDWAGLIARYGSGPATFLAALLYSPPAGGGHHEGQIPGRPDLRYSWNGDETELDIVQISNGRVVMRATLGPDGKFRNRGRAIAQETRDGVLVDAAMLPSGQSQPKNKDDEPELCPEPPVPDKPGNAGPGGDRGRAYAELMRKRINPAQPTPAGLTYVLLNPVTGRIVRFDDCQQAPGMFNRSGIYSAPGTMDEFKSGYGDKLEKKHPFGVAFTETQRTEWPEQALRQVQAAGDRPVIWYFDDPDGLEFAHKLFKDDPELSKIRLELWPFDEGSKWERMLSNSLITSA